MRRWPFWGRTAVSEHMEDICRANYLCNELGMDTITAGAMVSCAMELFEKATCPKKTSATP